MIMNNINSFNKIIKYIEENLSSEIDIGYLAKESGLSVYEFRRVFSFAAGLPIGEYIRKRRMSRAAEDIINEDISVTELAGRYGYDVPSSFSRAFKEFHGGSPNEIKNGGKINMFTPIEIELCVGGGVDISYSVRRDGEFFVAGIAGESDMSDTECCENVWSAFYENPRSDELLAMCGDELYAVYENGGEAVRCTLGARNYSSPGFKTVKIPAATWMCFKLSGADDDKVNEFYKNILWRFMQASSCKRDESFPNIEIFPSDMDDPDFEWEIRVAVKEKC